MIIQCLAIESDTKKQLELETLFNSLSDQFQIKFNPTVVDAVENENLTAFSIIICNSATITSFPILLQFLVTGQLRSRILFIGKNLIPKHELAPNPDLLAGTLNGTITPAILGGKILTATGHLFYQGSMTGMGCASICQLIDLDKLTCTLIFSHPGHKDEGVIFFRTGRPIDAQFGQLIQDEAVQRIFMMKDPTIKMYNTCPVTEDHLRTNCSKMIFNHIDGKSETITRKNNVSSTPTTGLAGLFMKVSKDNNLRNN